MEKTFEANNMPVFFQNTLTKKLEVFIPSHPLSIYLCGPTLYDDIHIGNSRPIILFDALVSFFKNFYKTPVLYVRNITDIDDKIIQRCELLKKPYEIFIQEQIQNFEEVLPYIQVNTPYTCRVTHHIPDIIQNIEKIISQGYGYKTPLGNVYFSVEKFPSYKILAGNKRKDVESFSVENEKDKNHWEDFALWKRSEGSVTWDSPWGRGVPGWHIECSTMAIKYLGNTVDIHGGGQDLIFPHHDNEIAQCWGMTGEIFCNYWIHNGMILIEGKKMSKSLNNFIYLKEIVKNKEEGDILKYLILSTAYRQPLNFSQDKWKDAVNNVKKSNYFYKKIKIFIKRICTINS